MKHLYTVTLLFLNCISALAQVNIDTCQSRARANYPQIKQFDLIEKSTEYTISNANKAYLPHISLTGIAGYIIGGLPTIGAPGQAADEPNKFQLIGIGQLNQVIWDGGATGTQKNIAKAGAEVEKSSVDVALYSIRERVNQLFFGILLIDEQLKQLEIHNRNLNLNLDRVKLSKDNGLAYQTDVDELRAEVLNLEQRKIEFNFTRKGYVQMLSLLTGQQLDENVKLEKPFSEEAVAISENNRPELTLYDNQLKLAEAQSEINKVNNMPKIGLLGAGVFLGPGMEFGNSKFNHLAVVGLSASWNTDGIFRNSNNKELDKIKMDKIANQKETFLFNNKLQQDQSLSDIEKQKAIIAKDEEIVQLKSAIKNGYETKYKAGMCAMNDLINAMNKENEAQANRALHQVQLLMSIYNLKTVNGN